MKEKLKKGYFFLQKVLRKDVKLLEKIKSENLVTILNFHQVTLRENPYWSPLKPEIFDDLLGFLRENFEVALFRELNKPKSYKPLAVISFDDGYYNFIEYALPLLEKHGLRANMNIIPACVESGKPMWNIRLYDFLNSAPKSLINEIHFSGFDYKLNNDNFDSKLRYGLKISRFLKNRPRTEREELLEQIESLMSKIEFRQTRMMNAEEIKQIAQTHEIGVHSFSHESMEFEENSFFEEDLRKCFRYFEDKLLIPLEIYAFPNGSYRPEQIEILQDRGIKHTLLVGEDYAKVGENVYSRFTIYGSTKMETRFQALGFNKKL